MFTAIHCCNKLTNERSAEWNARVRAGRGSKELLRGRGQARHVEVADEPAREWARTRAVGEAAEPFNTQAQPDRGRRRFLRALRPDRSGSGTGRAALNPNPIRAGGPGESDGGPGVCGTTCVARARRVLSEVSENPGQARLQQPRARPGRRGIRPRHPRVV